MLQKITRTHINRYPGIFRTLDVLINKQKSHHVKGRRLRILSFGCSDGTEIASLRCYFPHAMIFGCDVDKQVLREAKMRLDRDPLVHLFVSNSEAIKANGPYDIILAMSVFCQYPDSKKVDNLTPVYPFSSYQNLAGILCESLFPDGFFSIMNSNYRFKDLEQAKSFRPVRSPLIAGNGFVDKFDRDGTRISTSFGNINGYSHKRESPDLSDEDLMDSLFQYIPDTQEKSHDSLKVVFKDAPDNVSNQIVDTFTNGESLESAISDKRAAMCLKSEVLNDQEGAAWLRNQWLRSSLDGAVIEMGFFWEPHEIIEPSLIQLRANQTAELECYTRQSKSVLARIKRKLKRLM